MRYTTRTDVFVCVFLSFSLLRGGVVVGTGMIVAFLALLSTSVVSSIISFGQERRIIWKTDVRLVCEIVGNSIIQWTKFSEVVKESERFVEKKKLGQLCYYVLMSVCRTKTCYFQNEWNGMHFTGVLGVLLEV